MNKFLAILPAALLAVAPIASAQEVDPGFGVEEPRPVNVLRRNGINPIARILLFPIIPFAEVQARLSPEKASCWNDRAGEVVGCSVVEQNERATARRQGRRPTPYQ